MILQSFYKAWYISKISQEADNSGGLTDNRCCQITLSMEDVIKTKEIYNDQIYKHLKTKFFSFYVGHEQTKTNIRLVLLTLQH